MALRFNAKQQKLANAWRKYEALFNRKGGSAFVEDSASRLKDETLTKAYTSVLRANTEITEYRTKYTPYTPPKWSYLRHSYSKPYHGVVDMLKKQHAETLKMREATIDRQIADLEANYPKVEKKLDDLLAGADLVLEDSETISKPLPGTPSLANQLRPLVSSTRVDACLCAHFTQAHYCSRTLGGDTQQLAQGVIPKIGSDSRKLQSS